LRLKQEAVVLSIPIVYRFSALGFLPAKGDFSAKKAVLTMSLALPTDKTWEITDSIAHFRTYMRGSLQRTAALIGQRF
jgi:hypothetical protein